MEWILPSLTSKAGLLFSFKYTSSSGLHFDSSDDVFRDKDTTLPFLGAVLESSDFCHPREKRRRLLYSVYIFA
jgi:hypothetical protein